MKVLHVSSYFHPHIGGMESAISQICRGLVQRNYDLSLYTSRDPPTAVPFEDLDGLKIRRFTVIAKPLRNPLTHGLLRGILRSDASIVHCHDEHAFTSNLAVAARILHDRPLILHCHGELAATSRRERLIIGLYDSMPNRAGYQLADVVIQVSPAFVPYMARKFGVSSKKFRVVPNAINPSEYYLDADPEVFRRQRSLPEGVWVLYVGALISRKGIETLIDIFPEIVRNEPNARLLIVGRGPLKQQLHKSASEKGISKNVFFMEGLNQLELSAAYKLARLVVLPTLADVAPTVVLEAMLFQRPVISTLTLGVREFFSETALLVEPGKEDSLREAVLTLLGNQGMCERMGARGQAVVLKNFQWEDRIGKIARIYESLL